MDRRVGAGSLPTRHASSRSPGTLPPETADPGAAPPDLCTDRGRMEPTGQLRVGSRIRGALADTRLHRKQRAAARGASRATRRPRSTLVPVALAAGRQGTDAIWSKLWLTPRASEPSADRPSIVAALVSSVDGQVTEGGRVADLTGPADQQLLRHLRTCHDAVLVGATTVRVEGYESLLGRSDRERRAGEGRTEQPLLCIVSGRAEFDPGLPAFQASDLPKLILTGADAQPQGLPTGTEVLRAETNDAGELDLATLLRDLRAQHGIERILCEGGPTLIGSLTREGLLDELFLTLSPRLSGGDGPRPLTNIGAKPRELSLVAYAEHEDYLFTRYRIAR
jgi:riboflavin biosynthesis pyrimidine reductase